MITGTSAPGEETMVQKRITRMILRCVAAILVSTLDITPIPIGTQAMQVQNSARPADQRPDDERSEEIGKLLVVLRDVDLRKTHPEKVIAAIRRLGDLRASEAIDDLIELLSFSPLFPGEVAGADGKPIVEFQVIRYPATGALFQIGRPALPALVKVIEVDSPDSLKGQNALSTVQNIFRENLTDGVKYLESAAEASPTPESAKNLIRAADQLKDLARRLADANKR
jgi:PBS lyase HEAT-like repeat-containing protein